MIVDDLLYIDHIPDCIRKIDDFSSGLSLKYFRTKELVQDAIIRNIEIIDEASKKISINTKEKYHNIPPWKEIVGMRDKLIHDYPGVDVTVAWKTVREDLPPLRYLTAE